MGGVGLHLLLEEDGHAVEALEQLVRQRVLLLLGHLVRARARVGVRVRVRVRARVRVRVRVRVKVRVKG